MVEQHRMDQLRRHSSRKELAMDRQNKNILKERIKQKIEQTDVDIAAFELLTKPISPDNAIGRLTRMEAINSKSINEAALHKAIETRDKLRSALDLIDDPDFGFCRECDTPIPAERLMILPETDLCVQCAQELGR
jgi:DnaK suppressor protein